MGARGVYILSTPLCHEIAHDLTAQLSRTDDAKLEELAATLAHHARKPLLAEIVSTALSVAADSIKEGILFRNGLINLINSSRYSVDLRYAFSLEGEDMLPIGQSQNMVARASDIVIANIGPKVISGEAYSIDGPVDFNHFDPTVTLRARKPWKIAPGESLIVRGGCQLATISNVVGARFLSLALSPRWSLDWVFNRETLKPVAQSVAHVDDSQLVTCLEIANWLRTDALMDDIKALTQHSAHFVRWKAIQALAPLSPTEAQALTLKAAVADTHNSIRSAANSTIRFNDLNRSPG